MSGEQNPYLAPLPLHFATKCKPQRLGGINQVKQRRGKKRKRNERTKFIHGNYNQYYVCRNPINEWQDYRLALLEPEWFEGKRVLDVGCNSGVFTCLVGRDFKCKHITGVDVDSKLISTARKKLSLFSNGLIGLSSAQCAQQAMKYASADAKSESMSDFDSPFPDNVSFHTWDVTSAKLPAEISAPFDVILGLSLTKWLHLNGGDDAVKLFFKCVYKWLRPGGRFVLEPQLWKTYAKKSNLTNAIKAQYHNIAFRPSSFSAYLTETVGFRLISTLYPRDVVTTEQRVAKGFYQRTIYVFEKPADGSKEDE